MPRPKTKEGLVLVSKENYENLKLFISKLSEDELQTPFDFSRDQKKKEAHWKRDKNLRDVLIHLYEWHQLLLHWISENQKGIATSFLPAPYTWKTYGAMNIELWKNHQDTPLQKAKELFEKSYSQVIKLIEKFSNEELFTKSYFSWT